MNHIPRNVNQHLQVEFITLYVSNSKDRLCILFLLSLSYHQCLPSISVQSYRINIAESTMTGKTRYNAPPSTKTHTVNHFEGNAHNSSKSFKFSKFSSLEISNLQLLSSKIGPILNKKRLFCKL